MTIKKLEYHEIITAEQHPDCYDGPTCDQLRADWWTWGEGDKNGASGGDDVVTLRASTFPPGTKISVTVPVCPECGDPADIPFQCKQSKCDCGFDWEQWAREQYS